MAVERDADEHAVLLERVVVVARVVVVVVVCGERFQGGDDDRARALTGEGVAAAGVEHELVDDLGARRGAHDVERGLARRHVDARVAVARAVRAGHRVRPEAEARLLRAVDVHAGQSHADAAPELRAVGPVLGVVLRRRNRLVDAVR